MGRKGEGVKSFDELIKQLKALPTPREQLDGLFDYFVENLDCRISGSGDIRAFVDKTLIARITGSGDIRYKGHPESVDQKVSGSGNISHVD